MKKKLIKLSVAFLVVAGLVIVVATQVLGHKTVYVKRTPYDKVGFVSKSDFLDDEIILENSKYKFTLNSEDTTFELTDKTTSQTWLSNPKHDTLLIPADARELFVLFYERKIEASKMVSINDESIKYDKYQFRVLGNTLEVLYEVGGKHNLMMTDLPRQIGKDKFDEKILLPLEEKAKDSSTIRRQLSFLKSQFNYVENDQRYYLKELTSQDSINILYNLIFEESLYTQVDYEDDALSFGFETSKELPYFEFSVKYELTKSGFDVTLVNDSIVESEKFPMAYIDILPFFGAGNIDDEGYTVIPDGSGIYIDHNNQKYSTTVYEKRIYGQDLSVGTQSSIKPSTGQKIGFPMYGYNLNGYGYINVIEKGDSMSTMRAGFLTESSGGSYVHKIPYANYRFYIRERDAFIFQSSTQSQRVTSWTTTYNTEDFKMSYKFIPKFESTYFDMAKEYQNYLVDKYNLTTIEKQTELHITVLGGYKEKKYFLGFPYTSVEALTSVSGVRSIRDRLLDLGLDDFNMTYFGFSNDGVKPTSYLKTDYNKNIGSEKALKKLVKEFSKSETDLYLEFMAFEAFTDKDINIGKDVTENIFHKPIIKLPYDEATLLADKSKTESYILNTNAQNRVMSNLIKTTSKLGTNNISISDLGNQLASNLNKSNTMFRNEVIEEQQKMLERLGNYNLQLRNPNLYALVYAKEILDLSLVGTIHSIVDYDIPFVQLALNGYFNYSGPSVNTFDSKSVNWHMLKAIETGSNLQFTFTNEPTTYLVKTEYNYLYSTYFDFWTADLVRVTTEINGLNIYNDVIINHEIKNPQGSLIEVTYQSGLKIRINYEAESYVVIS